MIIYKLYKDGLYLNESVYDDPSMARVGFMFQDGSRTDDTFELNQESWTDPDSQGYFAFFVPSKTRNWDSFGSELRKIFESTQTSQFGWFSESEDTVKAGTLVLVSGQGTASPSVQSPFSFKFNNVTLRIDGSPFLQAVIDFDDTGNRFRLLNKDKRVINLIVMPPSQPQSTFFSDSDYLLLPMGEPGDPNAASVNASFQLDTENLEKFEAGIMYFGPGTAGLLTALSYPVLRAPGGGQTALNFSAWLDVLQPLVNTRSYFQCMDKLVGSFFADNVGRAFALNTVNGGDRQQTSRFAFANRPVQDPGETGEHYYLAPAGTFQVVLDTGGTEAEEQDSANLLCGVTGTEFLDVSVSQGDSSPDTLYFQTGEPAYRTEPSNSEPNDNPIFLESAGGNVTTSWVQFTTTSGSYVSQPQESPLYQQENEETAMISGKAPESGIDVHLLDFLPLPTWKPSSTADAGTSQAKGPLVPMAPYAGISPLAELEPFLEMESEALNPTRKNAFSNAQAALQVTAQTAAHIETGIDAEMEFAMTPQGLLAGLEFDQKLWTTTQFATSPALDNSLDQVILQFTQMGSQIRLALQQNQIFTVISTLTDSAGQGLFHFDGSDQQVNIAGWPFDLSPAGTPASDKNKTPPILIMKFYPGQSIQSLVNDTKFWSQPNTFNNPGGYTATQAQVYIQGLIQKACEEVYGEGNCPDGVPSGDPDTNSIYYNFYQVVTDPNFSGLLALNCNMKLDSLPTAIRAVTGGMTKTENGNQVSNIDAFRVHHVGVEINDTDPEGSTPTLSQSSLFGLVDYEKPETGDSDTKNVSGNASTDVFYNFEVQYLRALFTNSELRNFSCKINLTINNLFNTGVKEESNPGTAWTADGDENVVVITGSYQAHSTSGDDESSGEGIYSFIAEGTFPFTFDENPYLKSITLTKLQYSFDQETPVSTEGESAGNTTNIEARFSIWGNMVFKELNILDIFSFEKLTFADLGIGVSFDLTIPDPPKAPTTSNLALTFSPGNLRFDLAQSPTRKDENDNTSMLSLLPFKLKSFLYSEKADQTLASLQYFSLGEVAGQGSLANTFNYALIFDLDLGSMGGLLGSLSAFKFSVLVGWLSGDDGGIAFGLSLPEFNGKLEIQIQGVLKLVIEEFQLKYQTEGEKMLILAMHNSYLELLGTRLPPGTAKFDFALFAPTENAQEIGWIAAITDSGGEGSTESKMIMAPDAAGSNGDPVLKLNYLGGGQRVGPDPSSPPTTFKDFLSFMQGDFWEAVKNSEYDKVYHSESNWLVLSDFKLLGIIQVGFIFYDVTPFYSLTLNVDKLFNFEITYTKISDSVGLFYANFTLPDNLRKFQVGAASLTLPAIGVSVYTNGDWKLDVGFPEGDDWSRSFNVQAMAGPVPVTGSGGFYIASLSSATSSIFKGNYPSILAFGFAARLGVGKDFTSGPLKAGISVTFFGIIEGAAGYLSSGSTNIFKKPDALSLQGEFGVIGEIYGSVDFVIIKASVNVTLQASIGVILLMEGSTGGSILLYVKASVKVSASVKISFGFFSVSISFSFNASFRFDWQLAGSGTDLVGEMRLAYSARALSAAAVTTLPLCTGLNANVPLLFLPEATVIFPADTGTGTPWFVGSLGITYDPEPAADPTYDQFKPFEAVTTQLVTWALTTVLQKTGCDFIVTLDELNMLDQSPDILVGWIEYSSMLQQLAVFQASISVPTEEASATTFPMIPFLEIATSGRLDGSGQPDDYKYRFSSKNPISESYIEELDAYFNQLFVNRQQSGNGQTTASADVTVPLVQEVFLNYFTGLIRGGVNQLLETMQDKRLTESALDRLIRDAVGARQFLALAGQMSGSFRGGARLPYADGMTIPGGSPDTSTNPLYALLWQEFPVGQVNGQYSVSLSNPDTTQTWVTSNVNWPLTGDWVKPYGEVKATDIQAPAGPVQLPFTNTGPQSFAFENPIEWTQPGDIVQSLRPFPANLNALGAVVSGSISVLVESRETGAPYLPGGTPLPADSFTWATSLNLNVAQVPATTAAQTGSGDNFLPDVYTLSGASQSDQILLEQILRVLETGNPIADIQVLYQESGTETGLSSGSVNTDDVFALRTNTTTVSVPPSGVNLQFRAMDVEETSGVAVGATIADYEGFIQIIQQAIVTNATGYYLRYIDDSGNSLPAELFNTLPASLTLLITYSPDGSSNTKASPAQVRSFYNAIVLKNAEPGLLYSANTTDPLLDTQYNAVASGSVGVEFTRNDSVMMVQPSAELAAACNVDTGQRYFADQLVKSMAAAGMTDEARAAALLAESDSAAAQLNALYSLVSYQVEKTGGFIKSNLSAPFQPQQPEEEEGGERSYRVFVPLYNLADANQSLPPDQPPNRYASINDPFSIDFFQNDAFGNKMPTQSNFGAANYYFDPIIPVDQWQGVITAYDFRDGTSTKLNSFTVYLEPSDALFTEMNKDEAAVALQAYYTIYNQITGPGVSFYVETNFALDEGGGMVSVPLSSDQADAVKKMVEGIITYLQNFESSPDFDVPKVSLLITATGTGTLPPVFEMGVLFGITRDSSLISPLLKDQSGNITFPSAQNVASGIPSTVGASLPDNASVDITVFAEEFVEAFPALLLSVGLNGAEEPKSKSQTGQMQSFLKTANIAGDGGGTSQPGPQSLWAVQQVLLDITIGTGTTPGPFYLSPKPLDNSLNTAMVPLPDLPDSIRPSNWPDQQLFADIDLDLYNREFYQAVDNFLGPASASKAFEVSRDHYTNVANGRQSLAQQYSDHEVDWLFSSQSPFTGTTGQLEDARESFDQQMRAALMSAYSIDTLVQFSVNWKNALPAGVGDLLSLFGDTQPVSGPLAKGLSLSTAQVPVPGTGSSSLLTFQFGVSDVQDISQVSLDLQYNITHLQYFLEPADQVSPDEARPSIWLQLVNPYPDGPPHIGPPEDETIIPVVFREFPTPPTVISQSGTGGTDSLIIGDAEGENPLTAAAAWHYTYRYQAQLTAHDRLINRITYNTDLSATGGGSQAANKMTDAEGDQFYSLFEALARFNATYAVLQPILSDLGNANWAEAAASFSSLVTGVVTNTTWNPLPAALALTRLEEITDRYDITDKLVSTSANASTRIITLTWSPDQGESSFTDAKLSIEAIGLDGKPYPNQVTGTIENGITDTYVPDPPLVDNWIIHQLDVDNLNVLAAENALTGAQVERNLIEMNSPDGSTWTSQAEFIYMTPNVRPTQPFTPFVDNNEPIDIAALPNQGISTGCPPVSTTQGEPGLCQRIYTMLYDLLGDPDVLASLHEAMNSDTGTESAERRVKLSCGFQYPMAETSGGTGGPKQINPLYPVVLARTFLVDGAQTGQLNDLALLLAEQIETWSTDNVTFGTDAQPAGGKFIFDITLYAQLSGLNTPVLRLRNLQLELKDISPTS